MMDFALGMWVSGLIELSKLRWMLGVGEAWQPGTRLKLLFAGYNGNRNTGADVSGIRCVASPTPQAEVVVRGNERTILIDPQLQTAHVACIAAMDRGDARWGHPGSTVDAYVDLVHAG